MITTTFPVLAAEVSIGGVIQGTLYVFFSFLKYKKLWEVYIKAFPQAPPKYGRKAALKIRSLKASCI